MPAPKNMEGVYMAKRKSELGLGRGLNALLGDPELSASGEEEIPAFDGTGVIS